jgi:hypothetical protein
MVIALLRFTGRSVNNIDFISQVIQRDVILEEPYLFFSQGDEGSQGGVDNRFMELA